MSNYMIPRNNSYSRANRIGNTTGISGASSSSTSIQSFAEGSWWTGEEARLYEEWGNSIEKYNSVATKPYFDYFYTGQDVRIKIDALDDKTYLPVYSFGYQIQQQKQPIYGYASYVYDAMLRGTRIISGAFSIVATEPYLLINQIALSAKRRSEGTEANSAHALREYDGDRSNIERYWRRTYDFNLDQNDKHLFSIHPPFNFLIKYGLQETSLTSDDPSQRVEEIKNNFDQNSALWTNTNERLVEDETPRKTNILLENIELTSKSVEYDPNGDPILETYSFIARDERLVEDSSTMDISRRLPQTSASNGGGGTVSSGGSDTVE